VRNGGVPFSHGAQIILPTSAFPAQTHRTWSRAIRPVDDSAEMAVDGGWRRGNV
jgi:hypothetical protein